MSDLGTPLSKISDRYDAIIIGAGIGGLVCGCYLARAGMKVLIIEQHYKPGGYCTSFKRGRFTFEIGALENCRDDGQFGKIIQDLEINKKIVINRIDPSHIVVMSDYKILINCDIHTTISSLQKEFPHQAKEIEKFFNFIMNSTFATLYLQWRNRTLEEVLNEYFKDNNLKSFFSFLAGQIGVHPSRLSALTTATHYKESVFDGGYYPKGGMQSFANAFADRFREFGGKLLLSSLVEKIAIKDKKAVGIILESKDVIESKYVVSNCDATQTFLQLIGENYLQRNFVEKIRKLQPSISVFIVYLGINKSLKKNCNCCYELWYSSSHNIDDPWNAIRLQKKRFEGYIFCYFPSFCDPALVPQNSESITLSILAPYMTKEFWAKNKTRIANNLIEHANKIIPGLSSNIAIKEIATPQTLYKYTLNRNGAMRGWLSIPAQIDKSTMPARTPIQRLFLAGQWVTLPSGESGLPMAGYAGYATAKSILTQRGVK